MTTEIDSITRVLFLEIDGQMVGLREGSVEDEITPQLLEELAERWDSLAGARETKMGSHKVARAECVRVENGMIRFEIERHAGTMNGSTRAEVQTWEVDLPGSAAGVVHTTYRQLRPRAASYTKEAARKDAQAVLRILTGRRKNRGELVSTDNGGFILDASSFSDLGKFKRTIKGRRGQFVEALRGVLEPRGWGVEGDCWTPKIEVYPLQS